MGGDNLAKQVMDNLAKMSWIQATVRTIPHIAFPKNVAV